MNACRCPLCDNRAREIMYNMDHQSEGWDGPLWYKARAWLDYRGLFANSEERARHLRYEHGWM